MKKHANGKANFADVLERDNRYVVLTKGARVQVLVEPSAKQLRRRGKRGWHLFSAVDHHDTAGHDLAEAVQKAVAEIETALKTPAKDGKKAKAASP
jgi:hypothetical protein